MKLGKKVIVITGSGAGIGRASALGFAQEGASVIVADINLVAATKTVDLITAAGAQHSGTGQTCPTGVCAKVGETNLSTYLQVDVLVNNAAVQVNKTAEDTSFEEWNRQLAVNLGGVFMFKILPPLL